ncbi:MAG TPA: cytochrome P450 [Thermoanaerobaculia bacterium]|nr:cytochrome P450 [Thermoanaerobaculia bacterium]
MKPFDPLLPEVIEDPYPHYQRLRAELPIHWSERYRTWFVARYDDVVAAFKAPRLSADRAAASKYRGPRRPEGLRTLASEPPEHTLVRGVLMKGLSPAIEKVGSRLDTLVEALLGRMEESVEGFLDRARLEGEVDLLRDFAYPLPITVIADMFEVPAEHRERFQRLSHDIARGMDHFYSSRSDGSSFGQLATFFTGLVEERRARPGGDLMSRFLEPTESGERLTVEEAVGLSTALLFAGHETTVNLIGNGVLALLRNPPELERVRDDPRVAVTAVEELLRYDSPAQLIGRAALEPLELDGVAIARGDAVALLLGSANHDAARFSDPARLDVARKPNPHLAFGLGHHFCAGANLSRLEGRAAIPPLLRRFPRLRLGSTAPRWRQTAVLRGLESLPVVLS